VLTVVHRMTICCQCHLWFLIFLALIAMVGCLCGWTFLNDGALGRHWNTCQAARKWTLELFNRRAEVVKHKKMEKENPPNLEVSHSLLDNWLSFMTVTR
jgi:hypothetical protein